jgi:septal ring factor EnvC (AmiA/AmiB activator)
VTAAVIALASAVAALVAACVILSLKAISAKDDVIDAMRSSHEAGEIAAKERLRAEESERRRALEAAQLQLLSRECAAEKRAHEAQLVAIQQEIKEADDALRKNPHHRAERVNALMQKAAARGRPAAPAPAEGGDSPAGVLGGSGPAAPVPEH